MENLKKYTVQLSSIFIILVLSLTSLQFIPKIFATETTFQNISVENAYLMINNNATEPIKILDVRTNFEYSTTHLYNAINIPLDQLNTSISELQKYKSNKIIIYCKSGERSELASELLANEGFSHIYNMIGGISAWVEAGFPVWSISHNVTINDNRKIDISPNIFDPVGSCSCGCSDNKNVNFSYVSTILKENSSYTETYIKYDINGTIYENMISQYLLFSYNETTNTANKTLNFYYYEIQSSNYVKGFYLLIYAVKDDEFTMKISTRLTPLTSESYNLSLTGITYSNPSKDNITTLEFIYFNSPTNLSSLYHIMGKFFYYDETSSGTKG